MSSDLIFAYLCQWIENDYVADPTDCKRYAYCSNGEWNVTSHVDK